MNAEIFMLVHFVKIANDVACDVFGISFICINEDYKLLRAGKPCGEVVAALAWGNCFLQHFHYLRLLF